MFLKSFASILIVTSGFILAIGQTPEAKPEKERTAAARTFAFAFDGEGGYLGVQTAEVNKDNFAKYGLRDVRGVAVEKVMEDSPAASAGLKEGDVILRLNGEEITSTRKLSRLISEVAPDHQVKVTVSRNGSEQDMTATLAKRPMPAFGNGNFAFSFPEGADKMDLEKLKELPQMKDFPKGDMPKVFALPEGPGRAFTWRAGEGRSIGVSVMPLGKQLAAHFGVEGGVMVNDVRENSPAAKAGLIAGDIITEIDGKAVKGQIDMIRGINGDKKEGDVTLTIVRDHNRQTINVTPERSKDAGFFFRTGDGEDGFTVAPEGMHLPPPAAPPATVVSPAPVVPARMTLGRPARII